MNEVTRTKIEDFSEIVGTGDNGKAYAMKLLDIAPAFKYIDGIKSDEKIGYYVTGLVLGGSYDKYRLTLPLSAKMNKVSLGSAFLPVGFEGRMYPRANKIYYSLKCQDIIPASSGSNEG